MTTDSGQVDLTHWIYRLIAYIIDSIIIGIPAAIIYFIIILAAVVANPFLLAWGSWLVLPFLFGILQLLYFMILDTAWGGTIGKRVLGLQVQMVNGNKVPFDKSFIRNITKVYGLFLFLDWLVAVITPGADKRQKYTDRIAGTTVVQARQAFASSTPPPPPPPPPS
jgi:uncharacterized RDD family membrane protein YckC